MKDIIIPILIVFVLMGIINLSFIYAGQIILNISFSFSNLLKLFMKESWIIIFVVVIAVGFVFVDNNMI